MPDPKHRPTCVCYERLPGGKRERRVRPWPVKADGCEHPEESLAGLTRHRLRIQTMGGGYVEQCRLCGTVLRQEGPPVLEEPEA